MKCPYRKKIRIYPDGLGRTTEVEFMKCDEKECPYWVATMFNADECKWKSGCGKVKKECS